MARRRSAKRSWVCCSSRLRLPWPLRRTGGRDKPDHSDEHGRNHPRGSPHLVLQSQEFYALTGGRVAPRPCQSSRSSYLSGASTPERALGRRRATLVPPAGGRGFFHVRPQLPELPQMTTATPRSGSVPGPSGPKPAPPPGRQGAQPGSGPAQPASAQTVPGPRFDRVPMTGAQSLVRSLEELGCEVVFGIPGGTILPAYDPLLDSTRVRHVLVRHEQGAGHAAEGYAQATGRVGVCMATSGPGATNLVTPMADAYMDSVPIVAITGQQTRALIGTDAFQEADITGITMPVTKHNVLVKDAAEIPRAIAEAFHLASTGRPGPVLVDIPKDVLQERTTFSWPPEFKLPGYRPTTRPHGKQIREAAKLISSAHRPVLYVGGGVLKAEASAELLELAELTGIPVVTTLMARGVFPDSHRQHVGMPGMHGTVTAVAAMQESDLLVALGARFDDRATGHLASFAPGAAVVHADIDPAEISKNRRADVPIVGDAKEVIAELIDALRVERAERGQADLTTWWTRLDGLRSTYPLGYDWPADGSLS